MPGPYKILKGADPAGIVVPVIWHPPVYQGPRDRNAPTAFAASNFAAKLENTIDHRTSLSELKTRLRAEALLRRQKAWSEFGASAPAVILARGMAVAEGFAGLRTVSGYFPIRDEIDPLPLLSALSRRGLQTALPVTVNTAQFVAPENEKTPSPNPLPKGRGFFGRPFSRRGEGPSPALAKAGDEVGHRKRPAGFGITRPGPSLIFRIWTPGAPLKRAKFGLQEPGDECPEVQPELVLVPLLGFDRKGNRLGYGAGYYDAGLRRLRSQGPVTAIGVAFDEQEFPDIPHGPQDERLDMILTPSRTLICGG